MIGYLKYLPSEVLNLTIIIVKQKYGLANKLLVLKKQHLYKITETMYNHKTIHISCLPSIKRQSIVFFMKMHKNGRSHTVRFRSTS